MITLPKWWVLWPRFEHGNSVIKIKNNRFNQLAMFTLHIFASTDSIISRHNDWRYMNVVCECPDCNECGTSTNDTCFK